MTPATLRTRFQVKVFVEGKRPQIVRVGVMTTVAEVIERLRIKTKTGLSTYFGGGGGKRPVTYAARHDTFGRRDFTYAPLRTIYFRPTCISTLFVGFWPSESQIKYEHHWILR